MTALPVATAVDESLVVFSVVGVFAVVVDALVERVRPGHHEVILPPAGPTSGSRIDAAVTVVTVVAALGAVIAGVTFGPTGVPALDAALAVLLLVGVTFAVDGTTRGGGALAGVGVLAAGGAYALAAFGHDDELSVVMAAVTALALVSGVTGPTQAARWLRAAAGFGVALGALRVDPVPGAGRPVLTPTLLLALFVIDALAVALGRIRRREPLWRSRADHLPDRLRARGWRTGTVAVLLLVVQAALSGLAVFSGRAVLSTGIAALVGVVLVLLVAVLAAGATIDPAPSRRLGRWVGLVVVVLVVFLVVAAVPVAIAATDSYHLMERGRDHAKQGLSAARDGDTAAARRYFSAAAREFGDAKDRLTSPLLAPSLAVPYVASNVRAARTLSSIGTDLANAGESVTAAVQPNSLNVVDGRLPLPEVRTITPTLERGARVLDDAVARLRSVRDDPYLVPQIRKAVDAVDRQLTKASVEADHAALAARLAPALFGGDGPRRYLLVVQNNAESRATGGFIGNFGVLTAEDGKLHIGRLQRTHDWNAAVAASKPTLRAPEDYLRRYAQYAPQYTLQNVNLSPDFPTVGKVLMALAPQAGVGPVDGVMAVDPAGLAALLELTGPVDVQGWPTPITAKDVVDVALKEEYQAFADTPERAGFLGDIAQAAVDKATSENLGRPPKIAKVLGKAAHEGHFAFAFARPEEERLARDLGVAGGLGPAESDSLAVTTSNAGANKIDVYLQRTIDADVHLVPADDGASADVATRVSVTLANQAPARGLPQIVIGPYKPGFVAGENRSLFSLYSPLAIDKTAVNGAPAAFNHERERALDVVSTFVAIPARSSKTVSATLGGSAPLHGGWYALQIDHQPTYNLDQVHVSIRVPKSWRIDKAVRAKIDTPQRATATLSLDRTATVRVHVVRSATASLWERLNRPN